jgi:prevent-host-death family protein
MLEVKENIMVTEVNIHEAKTHLSKLLHQVMAGEEVIIAKSGVAIARIVPITPKKTKRSLGGAKGKIWISADFDAPLPADVLASFESD